jgi:FkbM family methyltransferase
MAAEWDNWLLRYQLDENVTGVLHCGAHLAEEAEQYDRLGPDMPVWWVEADPSLVARINEKLAAFPLQMLIPALLAEVDGEERTLHTSGDGFVSSVLELGTLLDFATCDTEWVGHVDLPTKTIDTVVSENGVKANLLVLDVGGIELPVLKGAQTFLSGVEFVLTEVNRDPLYVGGTLVGELDDFLAALGFERDPYGSPARWDDALYVRRA